jgi:ribosomal protein S18 acetylase RimI-like enzyme
MLAADDSSGQVAGFITAISDRGLTAHIPLVEVLPAYQGQGIGVTLLR